MWSEFKKFILRGNVIDLAVAVVIGAAFGAVVNSLVNDIVMPIIGSLTAGINFSNFKIVLREAVVATGAQEVAITYGHLIQVIFQFLIIALTIFLVIRGISKMSKKQPEIPAAPPIKSDEVLLLEEIRDLLKK
jgi:large conductance mechanosensitive channel